ncbi:MAG: dicarboxylate/amino acid:cation symporter [Synergistaceae bacterium]|jgi:Na+/H+-dicarboxylate symporter|nr:dicarboxylate/amino acid:cation symporter [Synergistaceae bacterium]MDD4704535.1 dicarboxylate/amino acid:cation symporter [Synergistaceae bacterium]
MTEKTAKKQIGLPLKILIAMVLGAALGFVIGEKASYIQFIGDVFIRLLKMCIYPLIFVSIINGISQVADMSRLKKVGGYFLVYWAIASTLAASMGLIWAFIIKPGVGINLGSKEVPVVDVDLLQSLVNWVPNNPFTAFSEGNILQIIVFALICGLILATFKDTEHGKRLFNMFDSLNEFFTRIVGWVISLAPYGVFALVANITGTLGSTVLYGLGKMLATQYLAYGTVIVIIYPIILVLVAKVRPLQHFRNIYPAMVLAFSTCSSSATLPLTMKVTKERGGVPEDMVNLIAPPAATINMHACAAEMPIYAVFAAQIYGIDLPFTSLLVIIALGIIMAAGVAGVPGGGIIMSAVLLQVMGLPLDIVPWIAGIYYLIDMPNTMLNVTGDTVGMVTVASLMKELDLGVYNSKK